MFDGELVVSGVGIECDTHFSAERIRGGELLGGQRIGKAAAVFRIFLKCDVSRNAVAVGIIAESDGDSCRMILSEIIFPSRSNQSKI